jgi:UDP-glucose 4-epimerase
MSWLVTGGAGYIGSHVLAAFRRRGIPTVAFDDLSSGRSDRVGGTELVVADVLDGAALEAAFRRYAVTGVLHLAAKKDVAESVADPLRYYRENVEGLRVLLAAMRACSVERIVFSSSAAVYGGDGLAPVQETDACSPANPYGRTKLMDEELIRDVAAASRLRWMCLRYFNVSGAEPPLEADLDSPSLVSSAVRAAAGGQAPRIYGDDYPTPDGTCVRDYVHVADVAEAHVAAALALEGDAATDQPLNVGTGRGYSVREVMRTVQRVAADAGTAVPEPEVLPRRPGDVARSVAAVDRIGSVLGWAATRGLEEMVRSTFDSMTRSRRAVPVGR